MTADTIKVTFDKHNYLIDTHTAVAVKCANEYMTSTGDTTKMVIASTASPYKFAADVLVSLGEVRPEDDLMALEMLSKATGTEIPSPLSGIDKREIRFKKIIEKENMISEVASALGI